MDIPNTVIQIVDPVYYAVILGYEPLPLARCGTSGICVGNNPILLLDKTAALVDEGLGLPIPLLDCHLRNITSGFMPTLPYSLIRIQPHTLNRCSGSLGVNSPPEYRLGG